MLYKVGEFAELMNTSVRTLRYYDEIDLFKPKEIDLFTGYRYYSDGQFEDFIVIKTLQSLGFTLDEIKHNWGHFNNDIMLKKKDSLLKEIEVIDSKIKEIDNLRSKIIGGKIVLKDVKQKESIKQKTIFDK